MQFLVENEWIRLAEGKTTVYAVTEKGKKGFKTLGMKL
jgi:predicted transcriptional regulator